MRLSKLTMAVTLLLATVFSFVFSLIRIEPHLIHHYQQIAFQTDALFFESFLGFAGGPGEYIATFLAQFFYSDVIGSLLISITGLFSAIMLILILELKRKQCSLLLFIAPVFQLLLLALNTNYRYPFSVSVDILFSLVFVYLAARTTRKTKIPPYINMFVFGVLCYVTCGGASFLIYGFSFLLLTINRWDTKTIVGVLVALAIALLIPYLAFRFFYFDSLFDAYFKALPYSPSLLIYKKPVLFYIGAFYIPVSMLFVFLLDALTGKKQNQKSDAIGLLGYIQLALVLVAGVLVVLKTAGPEEKLALQTDYAASNENWKEVVDRAVQSKSYDRMVNFQYNRAMAHEHRLLDELFVYPQLLGVQALFVEEPFAGEVTIPSSDLYFDLGAINEAEHYAFEAQTLLFYSPRVLKRLVEACMINERYSAAKTYLNVLDHNLLEKEWVEHYLYLLDNPALIQEDELISFKRSLQTHQDRMVSSPLILLNDLVMQNGDNTIALQYLIAYLLLDQKVLETLPYLRYLQAAGYQKVPTALEEAIILKKSLNPQNEILKKVPISNATIDRFNQFAKIKNQYSNDRTAAKQALSMFGNTYWYYVLFQSPEVTKATLNTRVVK